MMLVGVRNSLMARVLAQKLMRYRFEIDFVNLSQGVLHFIGKRAMASLLVQDT